MENGATLYRGGRVLVLDGVTPPQEALVVRDGRVAAWVVMNHTDTAVLWLPSLRTVAT